jgi:hypothetical protein
MGEDRPADEMTNRNQELQRLLLWIDDDDLLTNRCLEQ